MPCPRDGRGNTLLVSRAPSARCNTEHSGRHRHPPAIITESNTLISYTLPNRSKTSRHLLTARLAPRSTRSSLLNAGDSVESISSRLWASVFLLESSERSFTVGRLLAPLRCAPPGVTASKCTYAACTHRFGWHSHLRHHSLTSATAQQLMTTAPCGSAPPRTAGDQLLFDTSGPRPVRSHNRAQSPCPCSRLMPRPHSCRGQWQ